jgi:hypothetical protein
VKFDPTTNEVELQDEETIFIVYKQHRIEVGITNLEPGDQLPELDIVLPKEMCLNCWADHVEPAKELDKEHPHVRVGSQICVPLEN